MAKGCLILDMNRCGTSGGPRSAFSVRTRRNSQTFERNLESVQRYKSVRVCLFLLLVAAAGTPASLLGQGTSVNTNSVAVLQTGSGQTVTSFSQSLSSTAAGPAPVLRFSFGFSTDETVTPSTFLDSVSLTLQGSQNQSAIFFTVDAGGVNWAPATPGNVPLNPSGWTITEIAFPDLEPHHQTRFAYEVTAPLPSVFHGQDLNFHFDLFDNQNLPGSMAWITPVVIPEPGTLALGLFPLLFFAIFKRSRF